MKVFKIVPVNNKLDINIPLYMCNTSNLDTLRCIVFRNSNGECHSSDSTVTAMHIPCYKIIAFDVILFFFYKLFN